MQYIHIKTGKTYLVLNDDIINATNAQDGQRMVCYTGQTRDGKALGVFVRDYTEFNKKFIIKQGNR